MAGFRIPVMIPAAYASRRSARAILRGLWLGKSNNLAKVGYWLLQHNVSVMMAASDTFRSGAVEQLRTHAHILQIPIFERAIIKDPAIVAKEAIQEASRNNSDVLVDTAGRMQVLSEDEDEDEWVENVVPKGPMDRLRTFTRLIIMIQMDGLAS